MDGMMPVDELKARLALPDLPAEGSYHTLAGLVLALLRRVPRVGDRIVFAGWRFEVLEMDGRRVDKVRASREPAAGWKPWTVRRARPAKRRLYLLLVDWRAGGARGSGCSGRP